MPKSKQAKAREFNEKTRFRIYQRDLGQCIFCRMRYHMETDNWFALNIKSIMHFIPRSHNGLGIEQNGAIGCQFHHEMLDNGNSGRREQMLKIFEGYLREQYPNWNKEDLIYRKYQ